MKKIIVLDTNVIIDNPNIINGYQKTDIVIPYKVIEELDKHKYAPGIKGVNARDFARQLSELIDSNSINDIKAGLNIQNSNNKLYIKNHTDFDVPDFNESTQADDCILKVAVGLQKKRNQVTLLTNDILLKIKATNYNISTQSYDSNITDINSVNDLYKGYKSVEVSEEIMETFYQCRDKEQSFPISPKELTKEKLLPNDFVVLKNNKIDAKKKPYALLRYNGKKHTLDYVKERKLSGGKLKPMNIEQTMAFELLMDPSVHLVSLSGTSGTGKTISALAAGLDQVLDHKLYQNIIVIRPIHAVGKEIGFLPGSEMEKLAPWIAPIKDNLRYLLSDNNDNGKKSKSIDHNMNLLMDNGTIEIEALTYIRGRSINNAYIILDEAQNLDSHEMKAVLTRIGKNTKIIVNGDIYQADRKDVDSISNGLSIVTEKFKSYGLSGHVTMTEGVRSELSELAAKIL